MSRLPPETDGGTPPPPGVADADGNVPEPPEYGETIDTLCEDEKAGGRRDLPAGAGSKGSGP